MRLSVFMHWCASSHQFSQALLLLRIHFSLSIPILYDNSTQPWIQQQRKSKRNSKLSSTTSSHHRKVRSSLKFDIKIDFHGKLQNTRKWFSNDNSSMARWMKTRAFSTSWIASAKTRTRWVPTPLKIPRIFDQMSTFPALFRFTSSWDRSLWSSRWPKANWTSTSASTSLTRSSIGATIELTSSRRIRTSSGRTWPNYSNNCRFCLQCKLKFSFFLNKALPHTSPAFSIFHHH